jgi:hypothetical protein
MTDEKVNEETGEVMEEGLVKAHPIDLVEYDPKNPVSIYMNGSVFQQVGLVARTMSQSELVPTHLRNKPADCFLIVAQAVRWGMDPFAVAQSCYVASGKVGYEGKLIAGLINAQLTKKLDYEYEGKGQDRKVTVTGTLKGETKSRSISGTFGDWHTKAKGGSNTSAQWAKAPDQMLAYRGAREWARRHMPEAVLGIYSDDEVREIEHTQAVEVLDDTLDEFLAPAKVVAEDDPEEQPRSVAVPVPPEEEQPKPKSQAKAKAERKRAAKKTTPKKTYKKGDKLPDGRTVADVDDEGQPTVLTKKEEPPKAEEPDVDPDDAAIDALFSK